ncbi:MAG: dienelactone hydrolase family protein [Verrucomicrobia bacterium]|nr:dienelactone hydrolase family protein [Verrucomicrobiota bacterium]
MPRPVPPAQPAKRPLARRLLPVWLTLAMTGLHPLAQSPPATLPRTAPLDWSGDISARMVEGIDQFFTKATQESVQERARFWKRDFTSPAAYAKSVEPNRERLRRLLGAVDLRYVVTGLEFQHTTAHDATVAETEAYTVHAVRWLVFDHVYGEGLLLQPKGPPVARVVAVPDADQTPEMLAGLEPGVPPEAQFARRLAENGCLVVVPVLINRDDHWSGNPTLNRFTNQPHREWIYRQAYQMGRHLIGYEVQKILALVDWFEHLDSLPGNSPLQAGIAGYGEGGLLAFYSAALDQRIQVTLVSGYFGPRENLWEEPIYRNAFGLLHEFGDAEIASLIAPRQLIVEYSDVPDVKGPPLPSEGRTGAAPGRLKTPERIEVQAELDRARALFPEAFPFAPLMVHGNEGMTVLPGCDVSLVALLKSLGVDRPTLLASAPPTATQRPPTDHDERQRRQLTDLVDHTQRLLRVSDQVREEFFWNQLKPNPTNDWAKACEPFRKHFHQEIIGQLPMATTGVNPRSRLVEARPKFAIYEVTLDVWPEVFAWGYLLLPNNLQPGERRPVVVCQHGLEGLPVDTVSGPGESGYPAYKAFAARLADRGFVVFAPHNPYRGGDRFRVLQRKANPLKLSLFSVIIGQHDRILDWLTDQAFVDPNRIGFYGLSYGGKTAMRVPAVLNRYALSICSADFNDWIRKNVTTDSTYSYLYTGEYEMPEFNLGNTFNYAEMAALIAPRPFMVERGHFDGVAPDAWVAYEYAKVRHLYVRLGLADRTDIAFFDGPHTIHGVGTFQFLYKHLNWTSW